MDLRAKTIALLALACAMPAALDAQFDFKVAGRAGQVKSFASEGFAYSNHNNYLTMNTSRGSFDMTDGGMNLSSEITDKFRVGAQVYDRNIGILGKGRLTLDWALGDYRFKSWFGVRAGKVKTTLGLYNDTQDLESLHTWAILPQSAYPLDLRASTIAHVGVDVYGTFKLGRFGDLGYTGYAGSRPYDPAGGYRYGVKEFGIDIRTLTGRQAGGDLRWNNLVKGVMLGAAFLKSPENVGGSGGISPRARVPLTIPAPYNTTPAYAQHQTVPRQM